MMTVEDLIKLLQKHNPNLPIHIKSPEGKLISQNNLEVGAALVNWYGERVFITSRDWHRMVEEF